MGGGRRRMKAEEFARLLGCLSGLTTRQRQQVVEALHGTADRAAAVNRVIEERVEARPCCPHCQAARAQRWGSAHGLQRFRCTACRRTFNALTGTPLARLRRRDVWLGYASALEDGLSIRKAARRLGVHYATTFRWRHRWLDLLRERKDTKLVGIVEVDETYFLESRKGSRAWTRVVPARQPHASQGRSLLAGIIRQARKRGG